MVNSNKSEQEINLERFHLGQFFDVVVLREFAAEGKPSPQHLITVLNGLHVKPEETIVLGDSEVGMNCARHLNVAAVGMANDRTALVG